MGRYRVEPLMKYSIPADGAPAGLSLGNRHRCRYWRQFGTTGLDFIYHVLREVTNSFFEVVNIDVQMLLHVH
jgi:hypothetical protein